MPEEIRSPRLTRDQVCEIAGYGPQTLARRIAGGRMPKAIDRGRQALFDREAVYRALKIGAPATTEEDDQPITFDAEAFRRHRKEQAREGWRRAGVQRRSSSTPREILAARRTAAQTINLGHFVTLRGRVDGTQRLYFQVPARLRPAGWPSLILLPRGEKIAGDLTDPLQVAAIRADAALLYGDLKLAQRGSGPAA
jgi:hypothetical protein